MTWRPATVALGSAGLIASWVLPHRRSPVVRAWKPSAHAVAASRPLAHRSFGSAPNAVVLLHGLGATGDYYGAPYDRLGRTHRVIVPDLLGFGRSLDEQRTDFSLRAHLDALDALLGRQVPAVERLVIVAHSMGSVLGLAWAARHPDLVTRVICCGAPIYPDERSAAEGVAGSGPMARLFALDTAWARRACALSCAHRTASGIVGALAEPSLPIPITRKASLHTWAAFRGGVDALVLRADWAGPLERLRAARIPVTLAWGTEDRIGDLDHAGSIANPRSQKVVLVPGADHHLPITHAAWVVEQVMDPTRAGGD